MHGSVGRDRHTVSPFGVDRWLVPPTVSAVKKALEGPVTPMAPASVLQQHPDCRHKEQIEPRVPHEEGRAEFRLAAFQSLFFRVVAASVAFSTIMTLYGLMMMRR